MTRSVTKVHQWWNPWTVVIGTLIEPISNIVGLVAFVLAVSALWVLLNWILFMAGSVSKSVKIDLTQKQGAPKCVVPPLPQYGCRGSKPPVMQPGRKTTSITVLEIESEKPQEKAPTNAREQTAKATRNKKPKLIIRLRRGMPKA